MNSVESVLLVTAVMAVVGIVCFIMSLGGYEYE